MSYLCQEGRRNESERHKLEALNQCQKMVLYRNTEEATMATKRLKELLQACKSSPRDHSVYSNRHLQPGQVSIVGKEYGTEGLKEQLNELLKLLQQSEAHRKELEKEKALGEQVVAITLHTPPLQDDNSLTFLNQCLRQHQEGGSRVATLDIHNYVQGGNVAHLHKLFSIESSSQVVVD